MARINPRRAEEKALFHGFRGICGNSSKPDDGAGEVRNFRILGDGTLEKRPGWKTVFEFPDPIRGIWEGSIDGTHYLFVVSGWDLYAQIAGGEPSIIYVLPTGAGDVTFAEFRNRLYLFDGFNIYQFHTTTQNFSEASGYVPLYGKDWHPTQMGEVLEPRNMLSPRIRISYLNTIGATQFVLPFTCESVEYVDVDGTRITDYTFVPETNTFRIPASASYGTLTVSVKLSAVFRQRSVICRANRAFIFRNADRETCFCYGGNVGYRVYTSARVTEDMLAGCTAIYTYADPLYFPTDCGFYAGDAQHPVTAVCAYGSRVLIFNSASLWGAEYTEGEEMVVYPIEGGVGCSSPGGLAICDEVPVVVRESGVYRLSFPAGGPDTCVATSISSRVDDLLPASLLKNGILCWIPGRAELWLRDPTENEEGLVWVWNSKRDDWVCYDNIRASLFYQTDGSVGFALPYGRLARLDESQNIDDDVPIVARYTSRYLSFTYPENRKRSWRLTLCAENCGGDLALCVDTEKKTRRFTVAGSLSAAPRFYDFRAADGRFRFLRFSVEATGNVRVRLHRVAVLTAL